jgi:hypothetical protein
MERLELQQKPQKLELVLQPKAVKVITVRAVREPLRELELPVRARAD